MRSRVGEQELHRPVQAPRPIGSDIGVTVLGSTIDILQRRCDEQFAIHRAKDPELLGGMIDDPPEEPPSPVLIESLMPRKEWAVSTSKLWSLPGMIGITNG